MTLPQLPDLADGIYFGLPDEVYFALPRMSSSGVQNLIVSPATFWAKSWLNAKKAEALAGASLAALRLMGKDAWHVALEELQTSLAAAFPDAAKAETDAEATKAMQLGKAYHTARLEPELLDGRFARQPERGDFPAKDALWTGADIERELQALDEPKKKVGESVADQGRRLAALGYTGTIFPVEMADWQATLKGRTPIAAKYWDDLLIDMERLRESDVAEFLTGGAAEVTVLWTDSHGIRWKARIDYLRPDTWADLKTFDNSKGKNLEAALLDVFRFNRHYIQGAVYRQPVELLRANVLPIVGPASDAQREVIARIAIRPDELECWFIYTEKNGVPNILARRMEFFDVPLGTKLNHAGASAEGIAAAEEATRTMTFLHRRAREEINKAVADFLAYREIYVPGRPWQPWQTRRTFDDMDFPDYFLRNE